MKIKGFTLAEVLISLTIIGVIAAITVPVLNQRTNKEETATRLKKVYSTLQQACNLAAAEYGTADTWDDIAGLAGNEPASAYYIFKKYFYPFLNISQDCSTGACAEYKYRQAKNKPIAAINQAGFYLSDGTYIIGNLFNWAQKRWLNIEIDINGAKGPNISGRDLFSYSITFYNAEDSAAPIGKLNPAGMTKTREEILTCSNGYGCCSQTSFSFPRAYCAALIMKDSWQIEDDYPW